MSIYRVYLASWYPAKPKKNIERDKTILHEIAKSIVISSKCIKCNGKCTWKKAWGHHALPHGYGDVWCSKKCLKEA